MNRTRSYVLSLLALVTSTIACASPLSPTESPWEPVPPEVEATWTAEPLIQPTEIPPTITPTVPDPSPQEPTPESLDTLEGFEAAIARSVAERDAAQMARLMGDEFIIGYWLSEGQTYPASEGASAILQYAKPDAELACTEQPDDLEATLGEYGVSLSRLWSPEITIAGSVYCTGWGETQEGVALMFISQNADGSYSLYGTLLATNGF